MEEEENHDDQFYENNIDLNKLSDSVDMLMKLAIRQQRHLKVMEDAMEYGFPHDPSLYPKYQIDGITISKN